MLDKLINQLADGYLAEARTTWGTLISSETVVRLAHPWNTLRRPLDWFDSFLNDLHRAVPDLERREYIRVAGNEGGRNWIGCAGEYYGTFLDGWMDIPATGHVFHMRYHEFFRIEQGCVVELQALYDIPEVMLAANIWPLSPPLGSSLRAPAPATNDGLGPHPVNSEAVEIVRNMLQGLSRHADGGPAAMNLERYWHPYMMWYGPAAIGTCRGISGFRHWHQIPFLNAMPNRRAISGHDVFGAGDYVGFTAWPGMEMTLSHDGWLGMPPIQKPISMRSLDFWRVENGLIRENWVLVDLLDVFAQLGIDVFARTRELAKAKYGGRIALPEDGVSIS